MKSRGFLGDECFHVKAMGDVEYYSLIKNSKSATALLNVLDESVLKAVEQKSVGL